MNLVGHSASYSRDILKDLKGLIFHLISVDMLFKCEDCLGSADSMV